MLPILIIFNLFFGKLIFSSTRLWLGVEAGLILLLIININIMASKISRGFTSSGQNHSPQGNIIDIEGEIVEEKKRLK